MAAREVVLRAKSIADTLPPAAALPRAVFIQTCSRAASAFMSAPENTRDDALFHELVRREVYTALASEGLISAAQMQTAAGSGSTPRGVSAKTPRGAGGGNATPRTARAAATTAGAAAPAAAAAMSATPNASSSRSVSAASTSTAADKVQALKEIKPYLDPAFRSGAITREDYSAIALRLTNAFCDRFRRASSSSTVAAAAGGASAALSDNERAWVQSMVQREVDFAASTAAAASSTVTTPGRSNFGGGGKFNNSSSAAQRTGSGAAVAGTPRTVGGSHHNTSNGAEATIASSRTSPRNENRSSGGNTNGEEPGSPFERHLQKLREFVEQSERGGAQDHHHDVSTGLRGAESTAARRAHVVAEIADLQRQLAALTGSLHAKIEELQTLEHC